MPVATKHTVSALVQNESGTLNRLVSMFRRRGFSIDSLAVGDSEQPGFSRLSLVLDADTATLNQVLKQLKKSIDVVDVEDLREKDHVHRELAFIQVTAVPEKRSEIIDISRVLLCEIVHLGPTTMTIQVVANAKKIEGLITLLQPYGVRQIVRSGTVAMNVQEENQTNA